MTSPADHPAAQVLFVTVDEPHVRLDVVLLDPAVWGRQHLPAGTPISISFDVDQPVHQSPVTMFTTPGGRSISCRISARRSAVSGVVSAGLSTQVFPHASAGASFHAAIRSGKFQGMICPHTPTGLGSPPEPNAHRSLSAHPA